VIRAIALGVALAVAGSARAEPAADLLAKVDAAKAGITSLAGEFTQRNRVKLFKQELTSKGRFSFRKPRQIRWEYTAPDPSLLLLDGNQATLTTPGAPPQVFDLERDATMRAIFDQLLAWLGPGSLDAARAEYDLAATEATLKLTPKPTAAVAKAFSRVELRFDSKSWLVRSILLVEKNGDEKEITFTRLQKN
jgi:outer membrane lipoprotein-sorting protein